jgi:hypothetical protein
MDHNFPYGYIVYPIEYSRNFQSALGSLSYLTDMAQFAADHIYQRL